MAEVRENEPSEQLSEAEASEAARRYLFRRFWTSGLGFWNTRRAWVLTIGLAAVIVINIGVQYGLNVWNRKFFDALENRDTATAITQGLIFPVLAAISVVLGVMAVNLRMATQRGWRAWLTNNVIDYWLANGRYFQLNLIHGDHGNPEYRIAEDLRIGTDAPVDFAAGLLQALLSALTFIVVLWTIGGALTITVSGSEITIPGFLVIGAVIYAVIASGSMVIIGRRFVSVAEAKNQSEAEYRYVLTRLRENGESIALLGGEDEERAGLDKSLKKVLRAWRDLAVQHMRTTIVSQGSGQLAPVIPVLLCAPKFLAGNMSLGEVMQAASAFVIVQTAFSWLVDNYPRFADWTASARRAGSLLVSLDSLEQAEEAGVGYIQRSETSEHAALKLCNLSVTLDDGTQVIKETEVTIEPGEKVLVVGESGTGKSSLVRALAGLWPWGGGEIQFRKGAKLFLLPQRPYLPVGTLRRAVSYPSPEDAFDADKVSEVMEQVGLKDFVSRLDEEEPWDQILSGGEKQRLAFARLILQEPDLVVLDEATSALDPPSQDKLMKLLREYLEKATVLSVGHRPELEQFHERKLVMEARKDGARLTRDINLMSKSKTRHRRSRWKWRMRRRKKMDKAEAA